MKGSVEIYRKILNYLYLNLSKTAERLPFSGRYWLEEVTRGVGEMVLQEFGEEVGVLRGEPAAVCSFYLSILDRAGMLNEDDYRIEGEGESVVVTLERERCVYQDFCLGAEREGLFFYCPRLGALQAVLKQTLGVEYSTAVEVAADTGICRGRIFPVRHRLKTETVTRNGDLLMIAGERAVLFTKEMYAYLVLAIREYAPHIMKAVLFDAGYRSSEIVARNARVNHTDPIDALNSLFGEFRNLGLGRAELVSLDAAMGHAVIRCHNSIEVAIAREYSLYRTPRVVCDMLRGKFSAYLSVILERPIICEELKCASMGEECCEFHAFPSGQEGVVW